MSSTPPLVVVAGVRAAAAADVDGGMERAYKGRVYLVDGEESCTKRPSRTRRPRCVVMMRRLPRVSPSRLTMCAAFKREDPVGNTSRIVLSLTAKG